LLNAIQKALANGIEFRLYTDYVFNTRINNKFSKDKKKEFQVCCDTLKKIGVKVKIVQGVHSKLLMMDNTTLCIGSFNWASAVRNGQYKNLETSIAYHGQLQKEIDIQRGYLESKL
jgi:phosphatidylserine/phosphatidylglycerophosphate/cardiolipin synthase-like enzyme